MVFVIEKSILLSDAKTIMEKISRIFLGKYARPKDKINLMGEIVRCEGDSYQVCY